MSSRWSDSETGGGVNPERPDDYDRRRIPKRTREPDNQRYNEHRNHRPHSNSHRDRQSHNDDGSHNYTHRNPPVHRRLDTIEKRIDEIVNQNNNLHKLLHEVRKSTLDLLASKEFDVESTGPDTDDKTPCPVEDDNW